MIQYVTKRNGQKEQVEYDKINKAVNLACEGLEDVSPSEVIFGAKLNLYEGITTTDIDHAMVMSARALVEKEPNYAYVAARLLSNIIYKEVFGISTNNVNFDVLYRAWFIENTEKLVKQEILNPKLLTHFDIEDLSEYLVPERDKMLKYMGLNTLKDRYLKRDRQNKLCQTPQMFHMVVAMGLTVNENEHVRQDLCKKLYDAMSLHTFSPSTPTLFNSGSTHSQLSSCYLSTLDDSTDGIMQEMASQAKLSKFAGGLGLDITNIRGKSSKIKSTNGTSSGVIPYAAIFDRVLVAFNQAGKRHGSGCLYLETWHIDIVDFLHLRKITGDERRRALNTDTAVWINDLLMEYKKTDKTWYLFSPDDCPDLHSLYGQEFKDRYEYYVKEAQMGNIKNFKTISSKDLIKEMYRQYSETAHPFHCFKDSCNIRYMNKHAGVINSSNLCCVTGDQLVPTDKGFLTVKELYDDQSNNKVVGRDKVYDASPMLQPVKNGKIIKITTIQGYSHKVTTDHPLWLKDKGWVQANQLMPGDYVHMSAIEGIFGKENSPELALLLGLLTYTNKPSDIIKIDLPDNVDYILEDVKKAFVKVLGSEPTIEKVDGKRVLLHDSLDKCKTLIFDATSTKVPQIVLRGNRETVVQYLKGFMLPQAIVENTLRQDKHLSVSHYDEQFLKTVQIILLNFALYTHVAYVKKIGKYKKFRLHFIDHKSQEMAAELLDIRLKLQPNNFNHVPYAKIKTIEDAGEEDAYCLTVNSQEHAWTCNGFITKNTEITEHTVPSKYDSRGVKTEIGETAVCTLNSTNLIEHVDPVTLLFNKEKLKHTVKLQVRSLDNAIDNNFYPTDESANSAKKNRQIGLGIMGFHQYLLMRNISYSSPEAVDIAGELAEWLAVCTIEASIDLAKERGVYPNYPGSEWSKGKLPQDLYEEHYIYRYGKSPVYKTRFSEDWKRIREKLALYGIRNGNLMAIAPTATISYVLGSSPSIDPVFSMLFTYENLSGKSTLINTEFVTEAKKRGIWSPNLIEALKLSDGDVSLIEGLPEDMKYVYATAHNHDPLNLIRCAAERNIWIDQAQSFNIFYEGNSLKRVDEIITFSHDSLLKTNYYMRSKGASKAEKSTVVAVPTTTPNPEGSSCSIEAMRNGEVCESCQ